jgi:hypothetical protein
MAKMISHNIFIIALLLITLTYAQMGDETVVEGSIVLSTTQAIDMCLTTYLGSSDDFIFYVIKPTNDNGLATIYAYKQETTPTRRYVLHDSYNFSHWFPGMAISTDDHALVSYDQDSMKMKRWSNVAGTLTADTDVDLSGVLDVAPIKRLHYSLNEKSIYFIGTAGGKKKIIIY